MIIKELLCCTLAFGTLLFGLHCSDPANPFLDTDHAKASVYTKTFSDRDTLSIFSRETLSVVVYLKEHLREVVVHIDNNRLGTSSDMSIPLDSYTGDPVKIPFSFYDTGWQQIQIRSLQHSGKFFTEEYSLYARSPLFQKTLRGNAGDTVHLKTESVDDAQVLYVWDFHDGNIIKEYTNDVPFVLKSNFTSTIGELYVTDPTYRSPSVPFSIGARTAATLELTCLNDSIFKDSVYTSQAEFIFKVALSGTEYLKNASLNGIPFDNIKIQSGSVHIFKTLNSLDTLKGPMKAVVVATDDQGTSVEKTFYIHYDNTVITELPKIILTAPATTNDTGFVMQAHQMLMGKVSGTLAYEQLYMQSIVNGTLAGIQKIVPDSTDYTLPVQLIVGWNLIQLQLSADSVLVGSIIAAKAVYLNYNPNKIDTVAPIINAIRINGVPIGTAPRTISRNKNVIMSVLASDNKQVTSVTINGDKAVVDAAGLVFSRAVTLSHDKAGEPYIVCVEDSAGNKVCDTVSICYNRIPEILAVSMPATMNVDSEYVVTVHAADPDSDVIISTLTLKGTMVDTVLTLINGSVRWTPALKDTGALRLLLHVSDPFFEAADTAQTVQVLLNKEQVPPVSFKTGASDFPDSLIVGGKPLSILLKVDTLTGTPPLRYTVYLKNPSRKIYDGTNPAITWAPTRADAGVQTLQVIVYDKDGFTDTINALVTVVAQAAATVWIVGDTLEVSEGGKTAAVGIRLSKPLADTVRISYKLVFATATSSDIKLDSIGTVTFKPGDTLVNMPFEIVDDAKVESDEVFSITLPSRPPLSASDSLVVDSKRAQLHVIIQDNDNTGAKVGVMLQPNYIPNVPEIAYLGEFPAIVLTSALPIDITVTVKPTPASTATLGSDFTIVSQDIVVKAGVTTVSLKLLLVDDRIKENTEIIELEITKLSNTTVAMISDQKTARVQVIDND